MSTTILGMSGKKGSGKNTAANYIIGEILRTANVIKNFYITQEGKLFVKDIFGDTSQQGILEIDNPKNYEVIQFLEQEIYPFIRLHSLANALKQKICVDILGLSQDACNGSDKAKNEYTHLMWEDMPGVVIPKTASDILCDMCGHGENPKEFENLYNISVLVHEPGPMTNREVMQYVGSNIFRKMYPNVWVDAVIREINKYPSEIALVSDVRFPNEVEGLQKAGGKIIRLTRTPYPNDTHMSETALDPDKFDWSKFDVIIDNSNISIPEQNKTIDNVLVALNILQEI